MSLAPAARAAAKAASIERVAYSGSAGSRAGKLPVETIGHRLPHESLSGRGLISREIMPTTSVGWHSYFFNGLLAAGCFFLFVRQGEQHLDAFGARAGAGSEHIKTAANLQPPRIGGHGAVGPVDPIEALRPTRSDGSECRGIRGPARFGRRLGWAWRPPCRGLNDPAAPTIRVAQGQSAYRLSETGRTFG